MITQKNILVAAVLLAVLTAHPAVCLDLQPKLVDATAGKAIAIEKKAQDRVAAWDDQRHGLQEEIRNLKTKNAWLTFQQEKYTSYIEKQQTAIRELERKREEMRRLRMELEPFLNQSLRELEEQVRKDVPFLPEERQRRLKFLHDSLNDYHIGLSEKLRRVVEALQVEASYGRTIDVTETALEFNGSPVRVKLLRLGRTALFYQTLDAKESGYWNARENTWQKIASGYGAAIGRAMDMAQRKRAIELLDIPIGTYKQ